jgi:hypothetical protein
MAQISNDDECDLKIDENNRSLNWLIYHWLSFLMASFSLTA